MAKEKNTSFSPKSLERKILGLEPKNIDYTNNVIALSKAYTYYSYANTRDDSISYILEHLNKEGFKCSLSDLNNLKWKLNIITGWNCRLIQNECVLPSDVLYRFNADLLAIKKSISDLNNIPTKVSKVDKITSYEVRSILDVEDLIDERLRGNKTEIDMLKLIRENNYSASECSKALAYYKPVYEEVSNISGDSDIREGYSKYSKSEIKEIQEFYKSVVDAFSISSFTQKRKVVRKTRAVKPQSAEKITSFVKYQKNSSELNISSLDPKIVLDSTIAVLYNTQNRIISYIIAEEGKKLSFHRTKILNLDSEKSLQKKVRKPEEFIPSVLSKAKMALKKEIDSLSTKGSSPDSFYMNDTVLILKTFK